MKRNATVKAYNASGHPSEPADCTSDVGDVMNALHRMRITNPKYAVILDQHGYTIGAAVFFGGDWIVRCGDSDI